MQYLQNCILIPLHNVMSLQAVDAGEKGPPGERDGKPLSYSSTGKGGLSLTLIPSLQMPPLCFLPLSGTMVSACLHPDLTPHTTWIFIEMEEDVKLHLVNEMKFSWCFLKIKQTQDKFALINHRLVDTKLTLHLKPFHAQRFCLSALLITLSVNKLHQIFPCYWRSEFIWEDLFLHVHIQVFQNACQTGQPEQLYT